MWGKIDESRMGMSLSHMSFSAKALALGPAVGPTANPHLAGAPRVSSVACAGARTLALAADGAVYSWGTCAAGSLGHGEGVDRVARPRRIEALAGIRIVQIAAGEQSSAAVSAEGDVYTWGWGGSYWKGNGGLGHGDSVSQPRPALVEALSDGGVRVAAVAVGRRFMLARTTDGAVYSWGCGEYGRCGNGRKEQLVPEPIELLAGKAVVQIAAGRSHALAVTAAGDVWVWGKNDAGQLGLGGSVLMDLNTMEEYPLLLEANAETAPGFAGAVAAVAAGANHSLALTRDGRVFQWGQRTFLQPQAVDTGYLQPDESDDAAASVAAAAAGASAGARQMAAGGVALRGVEVRGRAPGVGALSASVVLRLCLLRWFFYPPPPLLLRPLPFLCRLPPATASRGSLTRTDTSTRGETTSARACWGTPCTASARCGPRASTRCTARRLPASRLAPAMPRPSSSEECRGVGEGEERALTTRASILLRA